MTLAIASPRFDAGTEIPKQYTADGRDISPPLAFAGAPAGTRSLTLIVDDPDAPDPKAPQRTWVHWVLYNLPADAAGLAEGVATAALPKGTQEGRNDWGRTGWGGPAPPIGRHRYFFKLFALDKVLEGLSRPSKAELEHAMSGHVLAKSELIGTYERHAR
jgi:Raf kinase inhibitor-like YbhB/YbcL family protein